MVIKIEKEIGANELADLHTKITSVKVWEQLTIRLENFDVYELSIILVLEEIFYKIKRPNIKLYISKHDNRQFYSSFSRHSLLLVQEFYSKNTFNLKKYRKAYENRAIKYDDLNFRLLFDYETFKKSSRAGNLSAVIEKIINEKVKNIINDDIIDNMINLISELVENAITHANADSVLRLQILENCTEKETQKKYSIVSLAILSISDTKFYTPILNDFKNISDVPESKRSILESISKQRSEIDKTQENVFLMFSLFHDRVSTRRNVKGLSGGTGTQTISEWFNQRSDIGEFSSYVQSGNEVLKIAEIELAENNDEIASKFNSSNQENVSSNVYNLEGTVYNMTIALEEKK